MHTDSGHLLLREDPTVWIRRNPTRLLSVRSLKLNYTRHGGEGIIGDSIGKLTELIDLSIESVKTITYLPNILSTLRNLQTLHLKHCDELQELPPNLGDLDSLTFLSFDYCPSIKFLPDSLAKLSKLTNLEISKCHDLEELPEKIGELESLTHLSLQHCSSIKSLPSSIAKLTKLTILVIDRCPHLQELPANFGELESLTLFSLCQCSSIRSLPDSAAKLSKLTSLSIRSCDNLQHLPANMGQLKSLTHLYIEQCISLKECPSNLNVQHFTLIGCCSIHSLPRGLLNLEKLVLSLCSKPGQQMLANLKDLLCLRHLNFQECFRCSSYVRDLDEQPQWSVLKIQDPSSITDLSKFLYLGKLPQLSVVNIHDIGIKYLPSSITELSKLRLLLLPSRFILETLPYQLDESLVISVGDTHVRKTWKELKKEMEIFSSPVTVDPSGYLPLTWKELKKEMEIFSSPVTVDLSGYLPLIGDPTPWIQENYNSHSMARFLDLELEYGVPLQNITNSIVNITELTHLHITNGFFTPLPLQFTRITHLSLYDCKFEFDMESSLDSLGKLSALEFLHISFYNTELLGHMDLPVTLRQLTLCLDEDPGPLPDSMTKLSNLKALHLCGEGIQFDSLPEILNLEKLKLEDCYIKSLPRGLRHVEILHKEGMCLHKCHELGNWFNQLVDVETLSVTCHSIKFFPSVAGFNNLRELQLKDCFHLKELPPDLDEVVNLCTLNVSGTRIKSLPCSFSTLPRLQSLILPRCFPLENLPLEFRDRSVFDDTDDKYYEDMGYYDVVHETCSEVDNNTTNTIERVNEVVSEESEEGTIYRQQISSHQLLNHPDVTSVLGDSHGSEANHPLGENSHHTFLQTPCFPSSQHGLPPNFQHGFSSGTGKNLLVSENGQNEDNMHSEGYNFHGKDHNPISDHSIHHLRNQEVGEVEGEQNLSISAKLLKRKTHRCEPDVKITQNERNVEVEDNACESKGMEDEDCSIISPLSSSQKKVAGRPMPDIPPDSVFRNYLSCLSPIDRQICIKVASCNASVCLYSAPDPTHRITVGEAWCIFPDRWLSDFVLNLYLYDIQLRLSETSSTRLILPSLFQGVTLRYDERNPYDYSDCIQDWCLNTISSYIPRDLKTIEQVFIPVFDKNAGHWFLLVFMVQTKMVYILDSLGTTPERRNLSSSVMCNAELKLQGNKLYQLFKGRHFTFEDVEAKKQPNCHDCGMYVLKYVECDTIDEMKNTFYSTEDMRVERLKSLAKLVASKHNNNKYKDRFMDVRNVANHWREMPKNIRVNEEVSKESEEAIIAEQQQTSPQQLLNLPDALSDYNYNGSHSQNMDILSRGTLGERIGRNSQHAVQNGHMDITNSDTGNKITFLNQGNSSCNQRDVSHIENNLAALENRQIEINSESEDKKGKRKRNEITLEDIQSHFGEKQEDAAIKLGVKLSTIKRRCRELGIKEWPSSRLWRRTNKRKASSKSPSKSEHVVECLDGVNQHVLSNPVPDHVSSGCIVENKSTLVATQQHRDSDQRVQQHFDGANLGTSSTIVQPNECTRTIVVKATYKDVQVKVCFSLSSSVELLKEKIGKKLKLEVDKFKMEYQDEDQDWLLVADISDLEDALRVSEYSGSNVVRLCIDEA